MNTKISAIDSPLPPSPNYFTFSPIQHEALQPWPAPVDGAALLNEISSVLQRFVILPKSAPETIALWVLHTYSFNLRDTSTYLGIESPEKRCGKSTLLAVLSELVHRPVVAANISSPAWYRVIHELQPTLLIDEADTFLKGNHALRGILNSGCTRKTAFVVRVGFRHRVTGRAARSSRAPRPPSTHSPLATFSSWCPKALATIGRFPETLADRCIVIRMQRKTAQEKTERLRNLSASDLRRLCLRFSLDHASAITAASPAIPPDLHDRAADIWEPLLALADLAGDRWPATARQAALALSAAAQDQTPIGSLLLDILLIFTQLKTDRLFSRSLTARLNSMPDRPWAELKRANLIDERALARILRPYRILPKTIWIGNEHSKGYLEQDFAETFRRYIPRSEVEALRAEIGPNPAKCPPAPLQNEPPPIAPPCRVES